MPCAVHQDQRDNNCLLASDELWLDSNFAFSSVLLQAQCEGAHHGSKIGCKLEDARQL